jgi:hypothetical protein
MDARRRCGAWLRRAVSFVRSLSLGFVIAELFDPSIQTFFRSKGKRSATLQSHLGKNRVTGRCIGAIFCIAIAVAHRRS